MSIVSYAQNFEDVLLWRALGDVEAGSYLDIGAQDPVFDSVSLAFYRAGWRGIHVEPTPTYASRLREARPDEVVIEAAVSDIPGPLELHEFCGTGLSTGKSEIASRHLERGFSGRKILVPCIRLEELLELTGDIHWMKIDVEGMESEVLASWGESAFRPWVLVIEATSPMEQSPTDHLWRHEVEKRGYNEVYFDGLSRFFVHKAHDNLRERFSNPANVFDGFVVAKHHFTVSLLRSEEEAREEQLREEGARYQQEVARLQGEAQESQDKTRDLDRALNEANRMLDLSRVEQRAIAEQLQTAAAEHHVAIEAIRQERKETENSLRREYQAREDEIAEALRLARASDGASRIENARLEERTIQALERAERAEQEIVLTRSQLDTVLVQRERAGFLIRTFLAERQSRWRHLGHFLGFGRSSRATRALAAWSLHPDQPKIADEVAGSTINNDAGPTMLRSTPTGDRNPYLRADSLPELLSWDDVDFVRCAYVTVLGRQPDPEGEAHHTHLLRQGHSKLQILWQLRRSSEGPSHDPGISGLDRALKIAALKRNSWIGWIARLFYGGEGTTGADENFRQIQYQLAVIRNEQIRQSSILAAVLDPSRFVSPPDPSSTRAAVVSPPNSPTSLDETIAPVEAGADMSSRERLALSIIEKVRIN